MTTLIQQAQLAIASRFAQATTVAASASSSSVTNLAHASSASSTSPQHAAAGADGTVVVAEKRDHLALVMNASTKIVVIYRDVPIDAWFAPYVAALVENDMARGYKNADGNLTGEFGVENPITYAEVLKMALVAAGQTFANGSPQNESAQGTWASAYVKAAEDAHLSVFTPSLDVNVPATRGAVIQTIMEVMGWRVAKNQSAPYSDVPSDHPYSAAIATATFFGFISGDTDENGYLLKTFRPDDSISRAEVAKIIALAHESL